MVRAWYMDDDENADQRLPHFATNPPQFLDMDIVKEKTGVEYFKVDADKYLKDGAEETLSLIRQQRGYSYEDQVTISEVMPDYEATLKKFFAEHLHSDEEIRFIVDGAGYFDARDKDDRWIRIEITKNDMIVIPAGMYHRFTLDSSNYIVAKRYFVGEPVWTPIYRPCDQHPARCAYLQNLQRASA